MTLAVRVAGALIVLACFGSSAKADILDGWCSQAKLPSSIALCSDAELRALTIERQHAFDAARARVGETRFPVLQADQNAWVASYPRSCGLAPDAAPPIPLPPQVRDCMASAGRARIAYLTAYGVAGAALPPSSASIGGSSGVGPSFDCTKATSPLAKMICSSSNLSRIDLQFAQAYWALRQQLASTARAGLQDEDLEFLNSVRLDCDVPEEGPAAGSPDCVAEHYKIQRERWASRLTGVAAEEANRAPEQHVALQHDLQTLGFLARTATTDGAYGDVTRAAITAWQTARGRPTTGLIGNDDAQALSAEVTAQTVPHSPAAAASSAADVTQPAGADSIQLTQSHGVYMVPVRINGAITIPFILDSGAGDILVPEDVFKTLIRTRTVTESDFLAPGTYVLADGSQHLEQRFILHELRVGDRVVEDLVANVAPDKADPLLGQSFLGKLPGWAIDNTKQALLIGPGGERKRPQAMPASLPVVARNKSTLESNLGKAQQAIGAVLQEDAGGGLAADRSFCPSANLFDRANDGWEFVTNTQVVPINPDSNAVLIDSGMCEW